MAHFAELDENNVVLRVIVVHNNDTHDADGVEHEALGQAFCTNLLGGNWKQTSYNSNIRKSFAGIGSTYDPVLDEFVPPERVVDPNAPMPDPMPDVLPPLFNIAKRQ